MIEIAEAVSEEMPVVREIFVEYQEWLGVDLCFQGFDAELAGLPGCYAPPEGAVILARYKGSLAGCVAYRPLSDALAELKRLYVKPCYWGHGIGRSLFCSAMSAVKDKGYHRIVLDTLPSMVTARSLYEEYGFVEIPPYYANPVSGVKYFQFDYNKASNPV